MPLSQRPALRWLRTAAALGVLAALVAACAAVPPAPPTPVANPERAWRERQARLAGLDHWMAVGRLAIRVPNEAATLSLYWEQLGGAYQIRLNAPLGQGAVEITGHTGQVTLRTSGEQGPWTAASPEALLRERLGWSVPLDGLRYWILGVAEPGYPVEGLTLDAAGRAERLHQLGWEVRYADYRSFGPYDLPTRVSLENARVSARIVVHRWDIPA
jgi:outer membrane lipoprotein LolB